MSDKKHLICKRPFEWFEATERGVNSYPVFLCCSGWLPIPAGDLKRQGPIQIWNSPSAKEIRRSVTDGSFRYCKREFCPHLNEISDPVGYVNDEELMAYEAKIDQADPPIHLNSSYDKSCNLSCPSCRPSQVMAKGAQRDAIHDVGIRLLNELGASLQMVYITGSGDPFASKHFLEILTSGTLQRYPALSLYIHTNAQLLTEETWSKLKFGKGGIQILEVSIDGATKSTYEENRKPGNWEVLVENMKFISGLRKANLVEHLKISFVVQRNNYKEMTDFIRLGKEWEVDAVYFSSLNNWGTYSPEEYFSRAIHRKDHADHDLLLKELAKIDADDPLIVLGYFSKLLAADLSST